MRRRGTFLILALFFSVVLGTIALGLIALLPSESAALRVARMDETSSRVAEAGIRDTMAWISSQLQASSEPLTTPTLQRSGTHDDWSWTVDITADPYTPPNPRAGIRMYKLLSTASLGGKPRRATTVWLQAGETLAKYAYLNNAGGGPLWDFILLPGISTVEGPMHNNGHFKLVVPSSAFTGAALLAPINGRLTSSGVFGGSADGFQYATGPGYAAPSTAADYNRLNTLGRPGFQAGVDPVAMPASSAPIAAAAWGGAPPTSIPAGVTVNPSGGIFVEGDVDDVRYQVVAGNPVVVITQGGTVTTVTSVTDTPVGPAAIGSRLVQSGTTSSVVAGPGNGVLYANGDINSLAGVIKGRNTVATNFTAGKNLEITGNITRDDTIPGASPTSRRDKLGIVANEVRISDDPSKIPSNSSTHLLLYATMFADQQWLVESANSRGVFRGEIFGGIQSRQQAPRYNTFSGTTVIAGMSGPTGGGTPRIVGDINMAHDPPPLFPSSEQGQMVIRYWREQPLD